MTDKTKTSREEKISKPALYEKPAAPKNKGGRTTTYDPDIARQMCELLSEGIPLRQICRENEGFPAWRTVYDWMKKDADLSAAIAHARDIGCDAIAEDCLRIADTPMLGEEITESEDDDGKKITIKKVDMLGHRKLQIETRLKLLAKFNPKKYGERLTHAGDDANPVVVENSHNVFGELLKSLKMQRQTET